jgi:hypothetical protein
MLFAECASTCPGRNGRWGRLPFKRERDVSAVATSVNLHRSLPSISASPRELALSCGRRAPLGRSGPRGVVHACPEFGSRDIFDLWREIHFAEDSAAALIARSWPTRLSRYVRRPRSCIVAVDPIACQTVTQWGVLRTSYRVAVTGPILDISTRFGRPRVSGIWQAIQHAP